MFCSLPPEILEVPHELMVDMMGLSECLVVCVVVEGKSGGVAVDINRRKGVKEPRKEGSQD